MTAHRIFENFVICEAGEYLEKYSGFEWKSEEEESGMDDFGQLIDAEDMNKMMGDMLKNAQRFAMLAKANYVLKDESDEDVDEDELEKVFDFGELDKLYPLLAKPIMIDIAWNFVDYHDILERGEEKSQKVKGEKKKKTKQQQPQKQASWFGGLFGAK